MSLKNNVLSIKKSLTNVNVNLLIDYLKNNWNELKTDKDVRVFNFTKNKKFYQITIPVKYSKNKNILFNAFDTLAEVQDETIEQIIKKN